MELGGPDYGRMMAALRLVQDRIAEAAPPADTVTETAEALEKAAASLEPYAVDEDDQVFGRRTDLPARGQALVPRFDVDEWTPDLVRVHLQLSRFHLGRNNAAHGGVLSLLFDEILGRLANTGRSMSRTAYLHVNFRSITSIAVPLRLEGRVERVEGRKRFVAGTLYDGDMVTADADGLFVALRPGQP